MLYEEHLHYYSAMNCRIFDTFYNLMKYLPFQSALPPFAA